MIHLYREILKIILFPPYRSGLVLAAEEESPQDSGGLGSLAIPDDLFPKTCEVRYLPSGEAFLDKLRPVIADVQPTHLFLFPPFAGRRLLSDELRAEFAGLSLEEIAFQIAAEALKKNALLGSFFRLQSLSGIRSRVFREKLLEDAAVRLVLEHDHSWQELGFEIVCPSKMTTLLIEVGGSLSPTLRFFRCPRISSEDQRQRVLADLQRLMKQGGGQTQYGYVLREGLSPREKLLFERHNPELVQSQKDMAHLGDVRTLADMVEIQVGLPRARFSDLIIEDEGGSAQGIPVISGENIRSDGGFELEETRCRVTEDIPSEYLLKAGDLCLRRIIGNVTRLPVAQVEEHMLPLVASHSVIVLRPRSATTRHEQDFLAAYLASERALEWLMALGMRSVQVTPHQLEELPVPVPDEELSLALQDLRESVGQFDSWKKEAQQALSSLFDFGSPERT